MFERVTAQQHQHFVPSPDDFSPENRMVCGYDLSPAGDQGSLARSNVNGFPAAPGAKSKKQGKTEKDHGRRPDGNHQDGAGATGWYRRRRRAIFIACAVAARLRHQTLAFAQLTALRGCSRL
jgi:hypothetical protein